MKKILLLSFFLSSILFAQDFWEPIGFQGQESIFAIGTNPVNGDLFIGTGDPSFAKIYRSIDNGNSWTETGLTGFINSVNSIDIKSNGILFAATGSGLFRSTNNGDTWIMIVGQPTYCCFQATVFNSVNQLLTNAGDTTGILRSDDNGITWTLFNQGLSSNKFYDLTIFSNDQLYAGKSGGIFRSNDNGESWAQILSNVEIFSVALNNNGHIFGGKAGGIVRSTNNGTSWALTINFSSSNIRTILILNDGHIYVGSGGEGVYHSTDNGDNWNQLNQGLTNLSIYGIGLSSTGYLLAGTSDGIFRSVDPVTSVSDGINNIPSDYALSQNYPNPFNNSSVIRYSVPNLSNVNIKIFDLLGNTIVSLVDEEKQTGTHEITWYTNNLPSGVYFYTLRAGSYIETKKMLLIK